jgi:isopentenyl-diphosphate delta-isomerase
MGKKTMSRKSDHIRIALNEDVEVRLDAGWEDIHLLHNPLPEIDLSEVDLSTSFLGKGLKYPFVISALTGGCEEASHINETLAVVASEFGIAMEIGSQRILLEERDWEWTYSIARKVSPDILLMANIGAPQVVAEKDRERVESLVEMLKADALVIHLNFLQEAVMVDGEPKARGCLSAIEMLASSLSVPVIVKETGAGIPQDLAKRLKELNVSALDIGGAGGTSMALIESFRSKKAPNPIYERLGRTYSRWGIPTPVSILGARQAGLSLIASGGIRTGLDAAKAIALGADLVGVARPMLQAAVKGREEVRSYLKAFFLELRVGMFLCGALTIADLKGKRVLITGHTKEWLEGLGLRGIPWQPSP